MKSTYTVLLFIGANSATQLNTMRRKHHQQYRAKKWDAETEANTNITTYEAGIPAGYGGTADPSNTTADSPSVKN